MDIKRGWGHSDVDSVAKLAAEAEVKKLLLFHHDPWRSDEAVTSMVRRCTQALDEVNSPTHVEAATEGSTLVL
jgi:ribonuclease BN (tRNA processing enzyme)